MKLLRSIVGLLLAAFYAAEAGQYPTKPVRVLIHFPAGGSTDVVTRVLAQALGEAMGRGDRPGVDARRLTRINTTARR